MAMMDSSGWNVQDQALPQPHDDDFQQFLDMGGMGGMGEPLQFDFHDFQEGGGNSMMQQNGRGQLDTQMGGTENGIGMSAAGAAVASAQNQHAQSQPQPASQSQQQQQLAAAMTTATSHPSIPAQHMIQQPPTSTDPIDDIDAQIQFLQQQRLQHQQRHIHEQQAQHQATFYSRQSRVPPTPQSLEMPPNSGHFYSQDQRQQNVFENRYQRMKEQQDMAFTPLVSPAVTPLDPQFQMDPNFTMPGAYFSPLTSPALHAQSEANFPYDQRNSLSNHNSPADIELEPPGTSAPGTGLNLSTKARKNNASARTKGKANVRQSPISKPKKKTVPTPKMVSQVLTEMHESNEDCPDRLQSSNTLPPPMSSESENASVSPENLSDMPPPPPPQQAKTKSPLNGPQNTQQPAEQQQQQQQASALPPHVQGKPSPATPASLMKLPSSSANGGSTPSNAQDMGASEPIECFELPESANFPKGQLTPLDTNQTPMPSPSEPNVPRATSAFQPLPSPVFAKPTSSASASASPNLAPESTGPGTRKTPQLAPRSSKKRGSVSSVQVSPALRPKISPHVKPLLPGTPGMSAEDSASRLLMSKSNYQNLLEGNTVPGVSYPSELSTNLTSKRTSHKIAEQGRRNRINTALQEIAMLLPKAALESRNIESDDRKDKDGKANNSAANSKASTVELAIEYITQLKAEVAVATARAEKAEEKLKQEREGS